MAEISISVRPRAGIRMYLPECVILLAFATIPSLLALGGFLTLDRTGGLMVLGTILAQFIGLNRANIKHINNAVRIKQGKQPLDFSAASRLFAWGSLALALVGSALALF